MLEFIMLGGLPGSGKSTWTKDKTEYDVHSSDAIRAELFGDEDVQEKPAEVFKLMFERTVESLKAGRSVIYDATNLTRKNRVNTLTEIKRALKGIEVSYKYVLVYAPIKTCKLRNAARERVVPNHVIDRMLKAFELPVKAEGWDDISVYYSSPLYINYRDAIKTYIGQEPHDNPHHVLDIDLHMYGAYDYFVRKFEHTTFPAFLTYAILFHDLGKKFCKTYYNRKGELCDKAHYYNHANVGAYIALGLDFTGFVWDDAAIGWIEGFSEEDKYNMALLINFHMRPLEAWADSNKAKAKDKELLEPDLFWYLEIVNECDKNSEEDLEFLDQFKAYAEKYRTGEIVCFYSD